MYLALLVSVLIILLLATLFWKNSGSRMLRRTPVQVFAIYPETVFFYFTRKCKSLDEVKKNLLLLKGAGMTKVNFVGGERFLHPKHFGRLLGFCKRDLGLESVTIATDGSHVKDSFLSNFGQHIGPYIDVLEVFCDSFQGDVNVGTRGHGPHLPNVERLSRLCQQHGIEFRLNTGENAQLPRGE
ncbi:hypothetical protein V8E54_003232 [Elaphomyces granulatus]